MLSRLRLNKEGKKHRREMTNYAVKLMLLGTGAAMVVQAIYIVLIPYSTASDHGWELALQLSVTISALGLLVLLLGINQVKTISHWVASSMFILALTLLALFSDNPQDDAGGCTACSDRRSWCGGHRRA